MSRPATRSDRGFSLVELLIVIVILGVLATVAVFAVRGITDDGEQSVCATESNTLGTAIETYFAQNSVTVIPTYDGPDADAIATAEEELVDSGLLRDLSPLYNVNPNGTIVGLGACA